MKSISYCEKCNVEREYDVINGIEFEIESGSGLVKYIGRKAVCKCCGEELFVEEVEEFNQQAFEGAYKKKFNIISLDEIDEILRKYKIGKRPLSMLLGWGETTISRYYQSSIPSVKNSKVLKVILNNPKEYYEYLLTNEKKISQIAYKKSKDKLDVILGIKDSDTRINDEKISQVAKYIVNKTDVTPLGLQKLLYYVQVFYSSFFGKSAFISKCSAWGHGPVFGKIYYEYKKYKFNEIEKNNNEEIILEENLKKVVDIVIKYFGCYSARTLEFFTHNEDPWINSKDKEDKIIEKSTMMSFGEKIIKENNINSINELYKYSDMMYEKYKEYIINN